MYRGLRFVREPYGVTFAGTGCLTAAGVPSIGIAGGLPISGNANFGIAIGNTPPSSLYLTVVSINATLGPGLPYSVVGGPPCAMLYATQLDMLLGGFTNAAGTGVTPLPLGIPDQALRGRDLALQHIVIDPATYGAFSLPLAPSGGLQLKLGS